MATTPLTDATVPQLDYPDLIRRAWAGERVTIHDGIHPDLILEAAEHPLESADGEPFRPAHYHPDPVIMEQQRQALRLKTLDLGPKLTATLARLEAEPLDPSFEATMERARLAEERQGGPIRMGPELADALEEVIAMRKPLRVREWE